jgi:hypothetical protein
MDQSLYMLLPRGPCFIRHFRSSHLANRSVGVSTNLVNISATQMVMAKMIIEADTNPASFLAGVSYPVILQINANKR